MPLISGNIFIEGVANMDLHRWLASLCAVAFISTAPASASDQTGPVNWVGLDNTSPYAFTLTGSRTAKPACATDDAWVIVGPSTDQAKAMLAGVLSAYGTGRTIQATGTGTCDATAPTREKILFIILR